MILKLSLSFLLVSTLSFTLHARSKVDKVQNLYGVSLQSHKVMADRVYNGSIERTYPFPISLVKNGITNFTDKCNNDFKSWRKYTSEDLHCKYHNENLIESFVVNEMRPTHKASGEFYLVGRQVYNRGNSGYYELVQVTEGQNSSNQKTINISFKMLNDQEVKAFTSPRFSNDSAFDKSLTTFVLTEISPYQTHMSYKYSAQTDHWLLNKEVSVPQVFASISKSINNLLKTVEAESSFQKRKLASED